MTEGWSAKTLEGNCTQLVKLKQTAKIRVGELWQNNKSSHNKFIIDLATCYSKNSKAQDFSDFSTLNQSSTNKFEVCVQ